MNFDLSDSAIALLVCVVIAFIFAGISVTMEDTNIGKHHQRVYRWIETFGRGFTAATIVAAGVVFISLGQHLLEGKF